MNYRLPRRTSVGNGNGLVQDIIRIVVTAQPSGVAAGMRREGADDGATPQRPVG